MVEKVVIDTAAVEERDHRIASLQARLDELDRQSATHVRTLAERDETLRLLRVPPAIDIPAAKAVGFTLRHADDLEIIEGIGPKIAELLRADGITTFHQLAGTPVERLRGLLDKAGANFRLADPTTWPEQADLAAHNRWQSLGALQAVLDAGVRTNPREVVKDLKAQLAARDEEIRRLTAAPVLDLDAARAAGFSVKGPDDLVIIEGIGPKIAELLRADGIDTFATLARSAPATIQVILDKAGPSFRMANPATWPEQARLAANNQWVELKALQDALDAGNR